jgi:hypothetical protein
MSRGGNTPRLRIGAAGAAIADAAPSVRVAAQGFGVPIMKLLKATLLASLAATPALAGGLTPPVMEPAPIVEETRAASSNAGIIVPILAILLLGLALSGGNGGEG